jgi:predicted transcriptional regulator
LTLNGVGRAIFVIKIDMKSKKLTVRLPSEAASKLKIISAQTGRSVQDIIGQAVTDWLAKNGGEA